MKEQHLLVSTYFQEEGRRLTGHAYAVRRNPASADLDTDMQMAYAKLSEIVEQYDNHWLPILLSTKVSNSSAVKLQRLLVDRLLDPVDTAWCKYKDGSEDFFFAAFYMLADDPDNRKLMKLH